MKRKAIIASIVALPFIALFLMWFINKSVNERKLDEDRAALFDECMYASYYYLDEIQDNISIMIDYTSKKLEEAYDLEEWDFGEEFYQLYYDGINNNPHIYKVFNYLERNTIFLASPVCGYLENGGKNRKQESQAVRNIVCYWTLRPGEDENYEEYRHLLELVRINFYNSRKVLSKYQDKAAPDKYAWKSIYPMDKQYIWNRYNKRKNWPFNIFK